MTANELRQERAALLVSIEALGDWVGVGLDDAVPIQQQQHVVGDPCPDLHRVPIKALRRLDKALRTFANEALATENAKLEREVEKGA
jgi:hypothetical protein